MKYNKTMMQYFEWYYPENCTLWYRIKKDAQNLKNLGINMVWLPPAYKCASGIHDVGYGVYDLYDLGEFDQKVQFQQNMVLKINIWKQLRLYIDVI